MSDLTVIDFFCGAGGFSEGFRQQGFKIIDGIDNWSPAINTYNYNFGLHCTPRDILEFENSVEKIEGLPDSDVIIGSPPCVSFSSSNKSGKADKSLGLRLIKAFLRVIAVKKHKKDSQLKSWIMENVSNSTNHLNDFYTFRQLDLTEWAIENGYDPDSISLTLQNNRVEINSADFGVPQYRRRVFTCEITQHNSPILPDVTYSIKKDSNLPKYITLGDILNSLPKPLAEKTDQNITDPLYPNIKIKQSELVDQFYDTGLYICEWTGSKYLKTNHPYMGKMSFPEKEYQPSRTITATKIGNSREAIIFKSEFNRIGDGEFRTPTIREAATLMGFPITYQFIGSENIKWKLVGNAVCPPVSKAFAKKIIEEYGLYDTIKTCVSSISPILSSIPNLNTFTSKIFDNPPKRKHGARFRRHPFKYGNLTVTLSNYDIGNNIADLGTWKTSVQYGTGEGFPNQSFQDGDFRKLEPIIMKFEGGKKFIDTINNGFSEKIACAKTLQQLYETRSQEGFYIEPTTLVDNIRDIIESIDFSDPIFKQNEDKLFHKEFIPKKQIMALYAINKICSITNGEI